MPYEFEKSTPILCNDVEKHTGKTRSRRDFINPMDAHRACTILQALYSADMEGASPYLDKLPLNHQTQYAKALIALNLLVDHKELKMASIERYLYHESLVRFEETDLEWNQQPKHEQKKLKDYLQSTEAGLQKYRDELLYLASWATIEHGRICKCEKRFCRDALKSTTGHKQRRRCFFPLTNSSPSNKQPHVEIVPQPQTSVVSAKSTTTVTLLWSFIGLGLKESSLTWTIATGIVTTTAGITSAQSLRPVQIQAQV